jgi:hypothetical protein
VTGIVQTTGIVQAFVTVARVAIVVATVQVIVLQTLQDLDAIGQVLLNFII